VSFFLPRPREFHRYADCGIGVPMEVMGLMLGAFVDDYTVRVVDVSSHTHPYTF